MHGASLPRVIGIAPVIKPMTLADFMCQLDRPLGYSQVQFLSIVSGYVCTVLETEISPWLGGPRETDGLPPL